MSRMCSTCTVCNSIRYKLYNETEFPVCFNNSNTFHEISETKIPKHIQEFDLDGLNKKENYAAMKLPSEEQELFAKDDNEIGFLPVLKVGIHLIYQMPVQKLYVPNPLYPEVKVYIEALFNNNFIQKVKSSYSSPVVCIHKKDESLCLCVESRALNKKPLPIAIPSLESKKLLKIHHPIPGIQET